MNEGVIGSNQFAYCNNNPVNLIDPDGNIPKWITGALNIISGATQVITGYALGVTVGWTGIGLVAAGFLMANGAATVRSGVAQVSNDLLGTSYYEGNYVQDTMVSIGQCIAGDKGANIANKVYKYADAAATAYSIIGGTVAGLTKTAAALGKSATITKSTFSMLPRSPFSDVYKVTEAMNHISVYVRLPKPWFHIANIAGGVTDAAKTIYNILGE